MSEQSDGIRFTPENRAIGEAHWLVVRARLLAALGDGLVTDTTLAAGTDAVFDAILEQAEKRIREGKATEYAHAVIDEMKKLERSTPQEPRRDDILQQFREFFGVDPDGLVAEAWQHGFKAGQTSERLRREYIEAVMSKIRELRAEPQP